jgi:hypothetical protein
MSTDAVMNAVVVDTKKKGGKAASKKAPQEPSTSVNVDVELNGVSLEEKVEKLTELVHTLIKRIELLERQSTNDVVTEASASKTTKKEKEPKEDKKPRAPSAYNLYMKEKMGELKETHPTLNNIERMKMAAESWTESKQKTENEN